MVRMLGLREHLSQYGAAVLLHERHRLAEKARHRSRRR
jgi:hypothetical protein